MWIKFVLQGSLGDRNSAYYGGATTFDSLRAAVSEFELKIFEELKAFQDDGRADCLMCYIWPCSDLGPDERNRALRLVKRDHVLEGSDCLDVSFVRQLPASESAFRLIQFGLGLLIDALERYKFSDQLIQFIRDHTKRTS